MSLTKFGTQVREYRHTLNMTLTTMASGLGTSSSFLSSMETGRTKIPMEWVEKIASFFKEKGLKVSKENLKALACEDNESVCLEGLPPHQKMLVAGFANSDFNHEQLMRLGKLLADIHGENAKNGSDEH